MKMYILIKDTVPDELAPVIAAHASLACFRVFENDPYMQKWIQESFKKVICKVNHKEFEKASRIKSSLPMTESTLGSEYICVALSPRPDHDWPNVIKFAKKWTPSK